MKVPAPPPHYDPIAGEPEWALYLDDSGPIIVHFHDGIWVQVFNSPETEECPDPDCKAPVPPNVIKLLKLHSFLRGLGLALQK